MTDNGACRSCGASVIWTRSAKTGKPVILDAQPLPNGNIIMNAQGDAVYLTKHDRPAADSPRYQSHFVSCPQSSNWRSR